MSSNSLCHGVVIEIHSVVEIQIKASFAIKVKAVDGLYHEMKKTLALYIKLNTHQRIFNRVFRCHKMSQDVMV